MHHEKLLALGLLGLAFLPLRLPGQDPLPIYPENYKVLLENDRVRVLDFQLRTGAREDAHSHPAHVVYVITGFKVRFMLPDGRTVIRETKSGDVLYSEAVTHASENIGDTDAHGILVEMKKPPMNASALMPEEDGWLTAVTLIRGIEGKEEQLKGELLALAAPTRREPSNIAYDLYQSPGKKNHFMRFEVWRSPEGLEEHKATPHIRESFERRKQQGWTTEITTWTRVRE